MKTSNSKLNHLYLTHPSVVSSGAYNHLDWSSRIRAAAKSPQARIVTIHEMLHSELNNSTGFGLILIALADICRKNPMREDFLETLKKLVDRCRTVHEVFATTGSLLLLVDEPETTNKLLEFYPDYQRFYKIGLSLCSAFKGFTLRYNSLYTVVRVCMQSIAIRNVLEIGLDTFRLKDLRISDYPNDRLLNILRIGLTEKFWAGAEKRARADCPDQQFWTLIDEEERNGTRSNKIASDPRFDVLVDDLIRSLYMSCTEILHSQGIKCLTFNGHQAYTQPLFDAAKKFYSESQTLFPSLQPAQGQSREELIVRNLELERLILQEPYEGIICPLEKIPKEQWTLLVTGEPKTEHFFICARPAVNLKKQYRFNIEDEQFLEMCGNEPLLFIRRSAIEADTEKRIVEFIYVNRLEIFEAFFRECLGKNNIFSNVSLSVYLNNDWKRKWNDILRTNTKQTLLMDISQTSVLKFWAKTEGCIVKYELINLRVEDDLRSVMAFDFQSKKWPLVLAPCSSVTADGFVMYMKSNQIPENCFKHRKDIITQNQILLSIVLGHLFREEVWFDFQGAITEGTGEELGL